MAKSVTITLDRERVLRLNLWAAMQFKKVTGRDVSEMEEGSMEDQATFIWACLYEDDPELTVEQVAKLVHFDDLERITEAIAELERIPLVMSGSTDGVSLESSSD